MQADDGSRLHEGRCQERALQNFLARAAAGEDQRGNQENHHPPDIGAGAS